MDQVDHVQALEQELNYEQFEAQLKGERGFWNTLQIARKKARTGKDATSYRRLLERGIERAKQQQAFTSATEEEQASQDYLVWHTAERTRLGIPALEVQRCRGVEPWCEKWKPEEYKAYAAAFGRMCFFPSADAHRALKRATTALFEAFAHTGP